MPHITVIIHRSAAPASVVEVTGTAATMQRDTAPDVRVEFAVPHDQSEADTAKEVKRLLTQIKKL